MELEAGQDFLKHKKTKKTQLKDKLQSNRRYLQYQ